MAFDEASLIDLVIGTKFPSYFVRHPNKVAWLIHQFRAAYELCGTEYSDFSHSDEDVGLRQTLIELDTKMLGECRRLFANAQNTANRLSKFNGLTAEGQADVDGVGFAVVSHAADRSRAVAA